MSRYINLFIDFGFKKFFGTGKELCNGIFP